MSPRGRLDGAAVSWALLLLGLALATLGSINLWTSLQYVLRGAHASGKVIEYHAAQARSRTIVGRVAVSLPGEAPFTRQVQDTTHSLQWDVGGVVPLLCGRIHPDDMSCVVDAWTELYAAPLVLLAAGVALLVWSTKRLRAVPRAGPSSRPATPPRPPASESRGAPSEGDPPATGLRLAASLALSGLMRVETLMASFLIGASGLFLSLAWHFGAPSWGRFSALTSHAEGRIVESWVALELDIPSIRIPANWRASAKATPCAIVAFGGDWGVPFRRAYCGNRLPFNDSYTLVDLHEMAPGVPFSWPRADNGFVVPEIRLDQSVDSWLAHHEPDRFLHPKWPAKSALEWLTLELDKPLDAAVAGWTAKAPTMPLLYDPKDPATALPSAFVEMRLERSGNVVSLVLGSALGLPLWFLGLEILPLMSGFSRLVRRALAVLLLVTVPWWADDLPRAIQRMNGGLGRLFRDLMEDIDPTGRLEASPPSEALLVQGTRVSWRIADSAYAHSLGGFHFEPPPAPRPSTEAALVALTDAVRAQLKSLDASEREELFKTLEGDRALDLRAVEPMFLPLAEEASQDPDLAVRRAARGFLNR